MTSSYHILRDFHCHIRTENLRHGVFKLRPRAGAAGAGMTSSDDIEFVNPPVIMIMFLPPSSSSNILLLCRGLYGALYGGPYYTGAFLPAGS